MNKPTVLLLTLLLNGCSMDYPEEQPFGKFIEIGLSTDSHSTRTSLEGNVLSWTANEVLGLYAGTVQQNISLTNSISKSVDRFVGGMERTGQKVCDIKYYAYYPYCDKIDGNYVSSTLPPEQTAPFDSKGNYMWGSTVADYDEDSMPDLHINLSTHLFGIVKLQFTNSEEELETEMIKRVEMLSLEGKPLCGDFTFDVTDPLNSLKFDESKPCRNKVASVFSKEEKIGLNEIHSLFLFVRPADYTGIKIKIQTGKRVYTYTSNDKFSVTRGEIITLPMLDIAKAPSSGKMKGVACWGDSYTHEAYAYPPILQRILGCDWHVYDGGIAGERTIEIAARQGAIRSYIKGSFTFDLSTSTIPTEGVYLETSELTVDEEKPFRKTRWSNSTRLLNPCIVAGVECTVTGSSVARLVGGEEVNVPDGAQVQTYGARFCRDVDLTIIYMGANGGYNNDVDLLVKQHQAMIDFTENGEYLVLLYHNTDGPTGYREKMKAAFGDRALDLRKIVNDRAEELLLKTGVYKSAEEISEEDKQYIEKGRWPISFYKSKTDSHPGEAGETAISFIIHDKMIKLGYISDSYILDDVSDL